MIIIEQNLGHIIQISSDVRSSDLFERNRQMLTVGIISICYDVSKHNSSSRFEFEQVNICEEYLNSRDARRLFPSPTIFDELIDFIDLFSNETYC